MAAPIAWRNAARRLALVGGLLGGLLLGGCEEYGVDDTGAAAYDVNLVVVGFWSQQATAGHDFHVLVENDGLEASTPFQVRIYIQEDEPAAGYAGDGQASVSSLVSGEATEVVINIPSTVVGQTAWVVVDGADSVEETYEDDNVSGPLSVADR